MYSPDTMLDRFAAGSVQTATGPKIVVMCFDRLDRDLATALIALEDGDHYETNASLGHAQDLLGEMAGMLDLDTWDHAGHLLSVYDYLLRRLAQANAAKDARHVHEAQRLVAELGDAFRQAAVTGTANPIVDSAVVETAPAGSVDEDRPRLSVQA